MWTTVLDAAGTDADPPTPDSIGFGGEVRSAQRHHRACSVHAGGAQVARKRRLVVRLGMGLEVVARVRGWTRGRSPPQLQATQETSRRSVLDGDDMHDAPETPSSALPSVWASRWVASSHGAGAFHGSQAICYVHRCYGELMKWHRFGLCRDWGRGVDGELAGRYELAGRCLPIPCPVPSAQNDSNMDSSAP